MLFGGNIPIIQTTQVSPVYFSACLLLVTYLQMNVSVEGFYYKISQIHASPGDFTAATKHFSALLSICIARNVY